MSLIGWMLAGSILSSLALTALFGKEAGFDIWLGTLGSFTVGAVSWTVMKLQHRKRPEKLTSFMVKAFVAKMIFFAIYITVLLKTGLVRPNPFAAGLISCFIIVHSIEAIGLYRFQAADLSAPSEGFEDRWKKDNKE